jgi:thiol-disulfide isomerase/thioredoxin
MNTRLRQLEEPQLRVLPSVSLTVRLLLAFFLLTLSTRPISAFYRNSAHVQTHRLPLFFRVGLRPHRVDTTSENTSTQLSSSIFRNVEDMLDAFAEEPVLIYFTSVTCGPCRLQKKELQSVRDMVGAESAIKVIAIDTKKWPHVGSRFSIGKLPCLLFMKDKQELVRLEGLTKAEVVMEKVYTSAFVPRLR